MKILKYFLLLLPFFKPAFLMQFDYINLSYNIAQIIVASLTIFHYIKRRSVSSCLFLIILMETIIFISSLINNLNIIDTTINIIQTLTLCILVENCASEDLSNFIKALKCILTTLLVIDFIFVLAYPQGIRIGLYDTWLFGAKNAQITYILPTVFCTYVDGFIINKKNTKSLLYLIAVLLISVYILLIVKSATSIITLIIFTLLLLFSTNKIYSKLNIKTISLIYLVVVILIIFFQIQNNFSDLFHSLFGKDPTFTGRTDIWDKSLDYIKAQPFLGYGLEPSQIRTIKMNNIAALNCHNMLLEILYDGGLVLFSVFCIFWKKICEKVDNFSRNNDQILKSLLIAYMIELLTEAFSFEILLWIFILVICIANKGNRICPEVKKV